MDFWERIKSGVIVADGAMGTMLYNRGVPKGHCYDELNLSNPELIKGIHAEYISAGAEIIETNTFGANEYILGKYYDLAKKVREINIKGAQIAKEVAGPRKIYVAGAIGPITRPLETGEKLSDSEIEELFKTQILALVEGGVDLIIFETFSSLDELIKGFKVAKSLVASGNKVHLPIICQLSFSSEGRTILGTDPVEAATKLGELGVKIMGANCGIGPASVYEAITRMGHVCDAILSVQPNAGQPSFSGERKFMYPATPEYFAEFAKKYVDAGVSIIGGCCGTTPAHITAIRTAVEHKRPRTRKVVSPVGAVRELPLQAKRSKFLSPLQQKLDAGEFILSMEIDPPKGTSFEDELNAAQSFKQLGGDCVNIADNPMARLRMGALPLAYIIKQKADIEVILHFTCRDRNLLAIQADLIGAHAIGIQNILALTGDPPSVGDYPFATAVFEIRSEELIEIMNSFNQGRDWLGNQITERTAFFVGVGAKLDEIERTKKKISKGAKFIQTQPIFDIEELRNFVRSIHECAGIPIIASILVLANPRHAQFIRNEVPGIFIPDSVIKRMEKGTQDEGVIIAHELLQQVKEICQGACLMLPFGKYDLLTQILPLT